MLLAEGTQTGPASNSTWRKRCISLTKENCQLLLVRSPLSAFSFGVPAKAEDDLDSSADAIKTATPIKHDIITVGHTYNEHCSFVKFVERNWTLNTTPSNRSRR
jgi:hypothetical protein